MKKSIVLLAGAALLASALVRADQIVTAQSDTAVGGGFAGMTGLMLGAAAGGPLGALVGAGLGYLAGSAGQEAAGLEQTLYVIKDDEGKTTRVRSSSGGFVQGQQVSLSGSQVTQSAPQRAAGRSRLSSLRKAGSINVSMFRMRDLQ